MEIRPPHPSEYDIVRELSLSHLSTASRKRYLTMNPESAQLTKGMINSTKGVCFVAWVDGGVIGYVMGAIKETPLTSVRFAELADIKVREDFRNRGIGGQLANAFIGWGKERADRICVTAHSKNAAAIRFYERLGFISQSLELELER